MFRTSPETVEERGPETLDEGIMLPVFSSRSKKTSFLLLEIGDVVVFEGDVVHADQPDISRVLGRRLHVYCSFGQVEPSQVLPRSDVGLATYLK